MRDQYAGDVSDVLKFAFLRALTAHNRTLGVAWYYAPGDDGRTDGRHLEWRDEAAWRLLDEELHGGLSTLPERSIAALELAAIWPRGTLFHREPMPQRGARRAWALRKRGVLEGADLIFLDPDNGVGRETEKYATLEEIRLLRQPGRALVFITFPGRNKPHEVLLKNLHERVTAETSAAKVFTLRTNASVPTAPGAKTLVQRQRWMTVVDGDAELVARAERFAVTVSAIPRITAKLDISP